MSHIFISYSRKDIDFAQKIVTALAENNLDTWIDWKSIPKGERWLEEIYLGIEGADAFLFLISPDSIKSDNCNKEIAHAVNNSKRIIPVVVRDADSKAIPSAVSERNWIFCRYKEGKPDITIDNFDAAIEDIRKTIHTDYEWLKYHTELQVKALKWEQKKDVSRLLRGKELREAEEQLAGASGQKDPQPIELQRSYVLTSQRNEVRQRRQTTISLGFGLVIVTILAIFAWNQRNSAVSSEATAIAEANARATAQMQAEERALIARAGELAAQSLALRDKRFPVSLLLSVEAFRTFDTPHTRGNLLDATKSNPQLLQIIPVRASSIVFSPDGTILAANSNDGIILWDVDTHQPISEPLPVDPGYLSSIAFSPDGKTLASAGDNGIILWNVDTQLPIGEPLGHPDYDVFGIAFSPSPDDNILVAGTDTGITLWDVDTQQPIGQQLSEEPGYGLAFSPDGNILAYSSDDGIILWNVDTQQPIGQPLPGYVVFVFSPDGAILASGSNDGIILWDVDTQRPIGHTLLGEPGYEMAFSPDSKILASASIDGIVLWDVVTHQPIGEPLDVPQESPTDGVRGLTFSPDGTTLVSATFFTGIILWDVDTQQPIGEPLLGYESFALSPDGTTIAFGRSDGTINLWDIHTRQPISEILHEGASDLLRLAFSPDGTILASSSSNGIILLWDMDPHSWLEKSCQRAGRNFTRTEWLQYFPNEEYRKTCDQWPLEPEVTPAPSVIPQCEKIMPKKHQVLSKRT